MNNRIKNPFKLLILFLLPGIIIMTIYVMLLNPIVLIGYPNIVAFGVTALITLVPVFVFIMILNSKIELGRFSIKEAVLYKQPLKIKHYFWIVPALIVWAGGIFTLLKEFDDLIRVSLFSWFPERLMFSANYSSYDKPQLLLIFIVIVLVIGIIGPIIEEIYFRGFLLPRMEWLGWGAPILNAFLFSLYHFWSPWQMVTRFIAIIPLCIVSYKTKNIKVVIIAHCLLNIVGDGIAILLLLLK